MEPFVFDRGWAFDVPADELWGAVERTERYTDWWPWLVRCDANGLVPGEVANCVVQPPLPYRLRFAVHIERVSAGSRIEASVTGDLAGPASFELMPNADGCHVRLSWEVAARGRLIGVLATVARPMLVWGHDHIVEAGLRQFVRRALDDGR
jgi:hypothetical protein